MLELNICTFVALPIIFDFNNLPIALHTLSWLKVWLYPVWPQYLVQCLLWYLLQWYFSS